MPTGRQDLAYALERILFDHGCVVQVIEPGDNLRQAVRLSYAAGLITIVVAGEAADREALQHALPPDRVVLIEPEQRSVDVTEAAREIWSALEASGRLGGPQSPLTGGAGI